MTHQPEQSDYLQCRPRPTAFLEAKLRQVVHHALAFRQHPVLKEPWQQFDESVRLAREVMDDSEAQGYIDLSFRALNLLIDSIPHYAPETAHVLRGHLRLTLMGLAELELTGCVPEYLLQVFSHFPGNPYTLKQAGDIVGPPLHTLERSNRVRWLLELDNHISALGPAKPRGRPKKAIAATKPPNAPPSTLRPSAPTRWTALARHGRRSPDSSGQASG